MRVKKVIKNSPLVTDVVLVEPNNSLTPRQILQQYSQGLVSNFHESSDNIDDSNHSDDELVDNVVEFEDEFEARDFMCSPMYPVNDEKVPETSNSESEVESSSSESLPKD